MGLGLRRRAWAKGMGVEMGRAWAMGRACLTSRARRPNRSLALRPPLSLFLHQCSTPALYAYALSPCPAPMSCAYAHVLRLRHTPMPYALALRPFPPLYPVPMSDGRGLRPCPGPMPCAHAQHPCRATMIYDKTHGPLAYSLGSNNLFSPLYLYLYLYTCI